MIWEALIAAMVVTSPADSTEHWVFDVAPGEVTVDWSDGAAPRVFEVDSIFVVGEGDSIPYHVPTGHYVRFETGPAVGDSIDYVFEVPTRMRNRQGYVAAGNLGYYGPPIAYEQQYDELPPCIEFDLDSPLWEGLARLQIRVIVFGPTLTVFMDTVDLIAYANGEEW